MDYHLLTEFRGHGIAMEASRTLLGYAFLESRHERIVSLMRPDKTASQRVALKNGLLHGRDVEFRDMIHGVYTIDRRQYRVCRR